MDNPRTDEARNNRDVVLSSSTALAMTPDFENITINNLLMPQAASTVQRKQGRKTRSADIYRNDFMNFDDKSYGDYSLSTSLGILDVNDMISISELDDLDENKPPTIANERKLARNLLEKCTKQSSDKIVETSKLDFSQNQLSEKSIVLSSSVLMNKDARNSLETDNKSSIASMFGGISMTSSTAAAMAQYVEGDFCEFNSKLAEQFQAERGFSFDTSAPPIPETTNLEDLNMMSNLKLVEISENASLVSFGDYCKKKCGNYSDDWSNLDDLSRPSIGLGSAESPEKKGHIRKLVNTTSSTEKTEEIDATLTTNKTQNTECNSEIYHINLASIARILNNKNTPRSVIDKLLEMNKRPVLKAEELASDTYTLGTTKCQILADIQRPEKDTTVNINRTATELARDEKNSRKSKSTCSLMEESKRSLVSPLPKFEENHLTGINSVLQSHLANDVTDSGFEVNVSDLKAPMNKAINQSHENDKKCYESNVCMTPQSPRDKRHVMVGTKSQEVTTCLVGVPTKAEIEITNNSARWVLVSASLYRVQGDKDIIQLQIPEEITLIKPSDCKSIKIGVKITKLCKPIITSMQLEMTDMVTREKWHVTHLMCFIPEENDVRISGLSEKDELHFGDIAEDSVKTLPITIDNRNNVDVVVEMQIIQNETAVFSIDNSDETLKSNLTIDGAFRIPLLSKESVTKSVEFRGLHLTNLKESISQLTDLSLVHGKLLVTIYVDNNIELMTKEIGLSGRIGTVKIEPCETPAPIVIGQNQTKPFYLKNQGSIAAKLKSTVVESSTPNEKLDPNFVVAPESLIIKPGEKGCIFFTYNPKNNEEIERHSLIKITSENGVCTYPVVGIKCSNMENGHDHLNRCETPQNQRRTVSPSSPQSAASYGSLQSGRNSPGSSCGGSSVTCDTIPIRATHSALNWGSVRAGKRETKEFTIRNMSSHKLKLIAIIEGSDKSFKFYRDGHGTVSTMAISFLSFETKTLFIVFEPHETGACAAKIVFNFYAHKRGNIEGRPSKIIQLCGYCGYAKLDILETLKDMSGQSWLSLGNLNNDGFLETRIRLKNNGDLPCYAKMDLSPKIVNPDVHLTWQICPHECILEPKEVQTISLFFKPKKKDLDLLKQSDTTYVGTLKITHGDEPSRLRLRRLYAKMQKSGEMDKKNEAFKGLISSLSRIFPGEKPISDLVLMRDSMQNLTEFCRGINEHEIKLTLEMNHDESESIMTDTLDDTATFHSLLNGSCNDVTLIG